jgi:hypothetical protein
MPLLGKWILRMVGCALALSAFGFAQDNRVASDKPASIALDPRGAMSAPNMTATAELPDSPGSAWLKSQSQSGQADNSPNSSSASQQQSNAQPQKIEQPVGTAAAEGPAVKGITAAEPAGVAIAPGKQRRVRTIVIKVGAIVGAGAAIGTVIALSAGTSSKPPGAR